MARKTKVQKIDVEVEEALEQALDFNFDAAAVKDISAESKDSLIDLDDLAEQIAQATEEIAAETASTPKEKTQTGPAVDESVAEQLFGKKPERESSGGTVHEPLVLQQPRPANDDITKAKAPIARTPISRKPSSRIYWSTTALSALWAAGGAVVANNLAPAGIGALMASPVGIAVAAGTAVPILMFWGFAQLAKRSNELQDVAAAMRDAAARLGHADKPAENQVVALGKTVQEEVAAMSEGIERTLARAVELEALIQGEVQNLERAYTDNEARIHSLIGELSNEREAILGHADRVQNTIRGTQQQLSSEFGSITSTISTNVGTVAKTLSETLQRQGNDLIAKLSEAGQNVSNDLAAKFRQTADEIQRHNSQLFDSIEDRLNVAADRFDENGRRLADTFNSGAAEAEHHAREISGRMQVAAERVFSEFDEKISGLNDRADQLSSRFDNVSSTAIEAFEKRLAEVDSSLGDRSTSIIQSFIDRAQTLEENTEKLGNILEERAAQINETLKARTIDIANTFSNGKNEFLTTINDGKQLLADEIASLNVSLTDVIKSRAEDFKNQLAEGRDLINEMLGGETDNLVQAVKGQIDVLSSHVASIEDVLIKNVRTFDEHAQEHVGIIEKRSIALQQSMEKSFETASELLDTQTQNLNTRADALRDSLTVNSSALNEVLVDQARVLEERIDHIREIILKGDNDFGQAVSKQILFVKDAVENNNSLLAATFENHLQTLESHTNLLKNALNNSNESLIVSLDSRIGSLNENLSNQSKQIAARATELEQNLTSTLTDVSNSLEKQTNILGQRSNELKHVVTENNEQINRSFSQQTAILEERTQTMQKALDVGVHNVKSALENSAVSLAGSLRENITVVSDIFTNETQKAAEALTATGEKFVTSLTSETDKASTLLNNTNTALVSNIAEASEKASSMIAAAGNGLTSSLIEQITRADTIISGSHEALVASVDQAANNAANIISQSGGQVLTSISAETDKLRSSLSTVSDNIKSSISGESNKVQAAISHAGHDLVSSLADVAVKAESVLSSTGKRVVNSFAEGAQTATKTLNSAGDHLVASLNDKINDATVKFNEAGEALTTSLSDEVSRAETIINDQAQKLTSSIEASATTIEQHLVDRSSVLNETVLQLQNNLGARLDTIGENLTTVVAGTSSQIAGNVEQLTDMATNLGQAAQQASNSLGTLTTHFGEKLNAVTQEAEHRIHAQNEALMTAFSQRSAETIKAVSATKEDLVGNVSGLLTQMDQSVEKIASNTNAMISSIKDIDGQFNETANVFYKNTAQIADHLSNTGQMLNSNVETLQGLSQQTAEQIGLLTGNLDHHANVLNQAIKLLDKSQNSLNMTIEEKQNALAKLGNALVEKSEEINKVISHYEVIIGTALQRADKGARETAAQLQQGLDNMVSTAAEKFAGATNEIKRTADSVKDELEKANTDINTTMRMLPSQTKESAEAMRLAVSDQIKVLQELSNAMQRNAHNVSVSRPTGKAEKLALSYSEERVRPVSPFKSTFGVKSASSSQANQPSSRESWVSNLLARASQGDEADVATLTKVEQPRTANHVVESLNSLAVDIVRAIDHNAAVELWDHYRRGQRNIYTQRLYTLNGQKTFEKIRQKYAIDGEFRRSVNQYIADFEKLLRDVSRETNDKAAVRNYLTSDTGKVYTMLAHASGRIQ